MTTLILGDVHGRKFWRSATTQYLSGVDKVVFLGDYLDPYQDEGITRKQSMKILDEIIELKKNNSEKVVLLIGNHDEQYISKDFFTRARYDSSNAYHNRNTFLDNLHLFQLTYEIENNGKRILFSHAGLMNSFVERNRNFIGEPTSDNLNRLLRSKTGTKILCDISTYRTYEWYAQNTGSILWSDINEKIDDPADARVDMYDYQIFGHTIQEDGQPVITEDWACLDCQKAFILDENNRLTMIN